MIAQRIYNADCLDVLPDIRTGSIDLVYIDPPFRTGRNHGAFDDRFRTLDSYLQFIRVRCVQLHRVLKATGSFYFHCDWHAEAHIRIMLDDLFGQENFRAHIVWRRATAKNQGNARTFSHNHDSIFMYSKTNRHTYNPQFKTFSERHVRDHFRTDSEGRRFRSVALTGSGISLSETGKPWKGFDPNVQARHWSVVPSTLDEYHRQGLILMPTRGGFPRLKKFVETDEGAAIDNLWDDIQPINPHGNEQNGYPTQKPVALLERIIRTSSNAGDIVLDAFCGSGTTLVAANNLHRKWIGIDLSLEACKLSFGRVNSEKQGTFTPKKLSRDNL